MQTITHWIRGHISLLAFVAIGIGIVGCGVWAITRPTVEVEPAFISEPGNARLLEADETTPTEIATIVVYISGAVRAPDVYVLPADARVKDLVMAAGGLTNEADSDQINLADKLADSQHVRVAGRGTAVAPLDGATTEGSDKIDLNTASADDLEGLPGIGAALAERIIAYRTENGPLAQVEDLQKVKGIGGSVYDKILPLVTVGL